MELEEIASTLEKLVKPYRGRFATVKELPTAGWDREKVLAELTQLQQLEKERWEAGFASGAVYHGDSSHVDFLNKVYALHSQSNPLHPDLFPSALKLEAEVVSMAANMLHGSTGDGPPDRRIYGTVTSGGSESLLLAVKTYRDWAREERGVDEPEVIAPVSAHAAFDKAAHLFGVKLVKVPMDSDYQADMAAVREAITDNTVLLVGSAPGFPHGIIDPISELAELAHERNIGLHVDACLGGFVLPWAERLGYPVPPFDFRLPGVTSMSADTHKYGYAAKGTSVVMYRGRELVHHQYFAVPDWPGGLYFSPTFAGSRPGALSAACWAALVSMGVDGYLEATKRILETGRKIREGVAAIPGLQVLGEPLWVVAFASSEVNIYLVMERMAERGWVLNGLQNPPAVHLAVTLRHTQPGVAERFLGDLEEAVTEARERPDELTGMAPIYGMAGELPDALVAEMLKGVLELIYTP